jgi:glycosyltransferase involved in cell wall biosynthesis
MHDLQEFHYPEHFDSTERLHRSMNTKKAIEESNHIIVSFKHVKEDIIKYFKVPEEKISICPPPFAESWFLAKEESSWEDLSMKFGIKKNYLLYPAATWKHKNHVTLIRVIKKLRDEGIEINLVCMGNKTNHFKDIQTLIDELKLSDAIYFLGIIPEEDLIGLYKNTSLVVIPTLYEAGSGPLYEAMRFEVPVVCSNVTSLPDTIGNIDFVFDPLDVNAIASKIRQGLIDVEFRRNNIQNSRKRMEEFQKFDYSKNFIEVYHKLIHTL